MNRSCGVEASADFTKVEVKMLEVNRVYNMDCLKGLKQLHDNSINCCVTSPPYWGLRDYGVEGQIGLENTPEEYVTKMVEIFREVRRVLRKDGTLWLNLGDSYCGTGNKGEYKDPKYLNGRNGQKVALNNKIKGLKSKDLVGIPWMVAFALRADGWYLRQDIIWHKPNSMPESVTDRCTKSHEYMFLLTKSQKYFYNSEAIKERAIEGKDLGLLRGKSFVDSKNVSWHTTSILKRQKEGVNSKTAGTGYRNKRSVWTVATQPFKEAHFATFPPDLIKPCILAGCPKNGIVLDPFMGSGTTGMVAAMYRRNFIGFELNQEYCEMAERRIEPYLMQQTIFDLQNISANNT